MDAVLETAGYGARCSKCDFLPRKVASIFFGNSTFNRISMSYPLCRPFLNVTLSIPPFALAAFFL
jgi:hypothetical protein